MMIRPFLWFVDNLSPALDRYAAIFGSQFRILERFGSHVIFSLGGAEYMAMQAGPHYRLTAAYSMFLSVETQAEVDHYYAALLEGGGTETRCGWLVDPFGVSWQVIPRRLGQLLNDPDPARAKRASAAMMTMQKIDIAALEAAANGA
jgi:predicted 3-demethylubiquinone-9 3-methyltransferase (glyoxalase superfamily)